jgi:hypothetical protein
MLQRGFFEDYQRERAEGPAVHTAVIRRGAGTVFLHFAARLLASCFGGVLLALAAVGLATLLCPPLRELFLSSAQAWAQRLLP